MEDFKNPFLTLWTMAELKTTRNSTYLGAKVGILGKQNERNSREIGWITPLYLVCVLRQSA